MRNLTKLAGGIALALFAGNAAIAADAVEAPPAPPAAAPVQYAPPAATWSGVYVGAFGGYNWGNFDSSAGDIDADGWSGGAFAGYNWQNGSVVYGLEGDAGYSGVDGSLAGTADAKQTGFGSLRARLGYAFDPVMIYGTGGLAITGAEVDDGTGSDTNTHLGWTVGAGAEALITDNVFGRLEYRYSDYQEKDYSLPTAGTVSSGFSAHTVNAGVGLKF